MFRIATPLLVGLALSTATGLLHAEESTKSYPDCSREPTDAEVAAAKGAFQAGNASFNEADYTRAIDYWEDAYRRDCTANPLLLNLARAYELAGRKRQAVLALEAFTTREPGSSEKGQIARRIEVLKNKIAEEDAAAAAAPTTPAPTATPAVQPPVGQTETPTTTQAKRSPWPVVLMIGGGVITVVGIAGYVSSKNKSDDIAKRCPGQVCAGMDSGLAKEGNDANTAMRSSSVFAGVGVAVLAGGVVWWFLDGKRVANANEATAQLTPTKPRLTPVVDRGFAGLSLSGAF